MITSETEPKPLAIVIIENAFIGMLWGAILGAAFMCVIYVGSWFVDWFREGFPSFIDTVTRIVGISLYVGVPGLLVGGSAGFVLGLFNGIVIGILRHLPNQISDKQPVRIGSMILVILGALLLSFVTFDRINSPMMAIGSWIDSPLALPASLIAVIASLIAYQRNLKRSLTQLSNPNPVNAIQQ